MKPAAPEIDTLFRQALHMHQQGSVKHARAIYERILEQEPQHFDACHLLGVVHMQAGFPERAVAFISRALTINPDAADAHVNLGQALRSLGRTDEALASIDTAISLRPGVADYHFDRAVMLHTAGDFPGALACLEEALRLDPAMPDAHRRKAAVLRKLDRLEEALASCEEAIRRAPRSAEAHGLKGKILGRLNRLEEALASHDMAIAIKPASAEAHWQRARILGRLNRHEDSAAGYHKAIQLDPKRAETYVDRAGILNKLKRHDEALASCDTAIILMPGSADAHAERGRSLTHLNRMDEALASFNTAVSLAEDNKAARSGRAWLHFLCGRWDVARQDYEELLRMDPADQNVWKGLAYLPEGSLPAEVASTVLGRCEASPDDTDLASRLFVKAGLLRHLGRYEDSFSSLRRANQLRLAEVAQSEDWKTKLTLFQQRVEGWEPFQGSGSMAEDHSPKLLLILGPSRSGKSTLENLVCNDTTFKRGYEGVTAESVIRSLEELSETRSSSAQASDLARSVFETLFPSESEGFLKGGHEVVTITNPFLLRAADLIYDLYPNARFVFIDRDAIDNAAEVFASDYMTMYTFAYRPESALDYVKRYRRLSGILHRKMGSRAMTVSYDDLLSSPGDILTSVYEMLGLNPPREAAPAGVARNPCSVYRAYFAALCGEEP